MTTRNIDVFIPPMTDFVAWKAFEPEECDRIVKLGELFEFHKAKIGGGQEKDGGEDLGYRDTDITWIEPNEKTHWIFDRMNEIVAYLNFMHFQMDLECFDGFQYSKYKVGGHYKRHNDVVHSPEHGLYRKLSVSVMLTDPEEYEGGAFTLDTHGNLEDVFRVKPKKGEMILFYSHIPHMVEPVTFWETYFSGDLGTWGENTLNLQSIRRALKGLKFVAGDDVVEFYCVPELFGVIPAPRPATKSMAPWFKAVKPVADNRDAIDAKGMSAKRCMPMLDAMTAGWIIPLWADVNIRTNDDCSLFDFGNPNPIGPVVETHSLGQLGGKTSPTYPGPALKFVNPWVIKTAKGVSSFFMPPVNHFDKRFTCFFGLVDTDQYPKQVNFPAIWHLNDHDEILPAGTPLVTMIPVRRSDLEIEATPRAMSKKEARAIHQIEKAQLTRRHVYTHELREPRK